jgi:hypothetical protein
MVYVYSMGEALKNFRLLMLQAIMGKTVVVSAGGKPILVLLRPEKVSLEVTTPAAPR